ncbi:hypothetical protein GCM10009676_28670 [Prauserella halophila]|uniref:Uncharacterized protein n=1 Tax=Prauserella halophila TaxID=185641 RepID=A0ABP4GWW7_9PSEU
MRLLATALRINSRRTDRLRTNRRRAGPDHHRLPVHSKAANSRADHSADHGAGNGRAGRDSRADHRPDNGRRIRHRARRRAHRLANRLHPGNGEVDRIRAERRRSGTATARKRSPRHDAAPAPRGSPRSPVAE